MIKIARMRPEDFDEVYEMEKASFAVPKDRAVFFADQSKYFVAKTHVAAQVFKPAGAVVGYIGFEEIAGEGHIINMAVDPRFRQQGIGKNLMEYVLANVGIKIFYLEVRPSNLAAIKLYEGFGFKNVGRRKAYYQDNQEDALIMKLER